MFYHFQKPSWKSIYSTNFIKSFNKQTKKHTKRKEQFFVSQIEEYNKRLAVRCHTGFDQACAELAHRDVSIHRLNSGLKENEFHRLQLTQNFCRSRSKADMISISSIFIATFYITSTNLFSRIFTT